MSKMEIPAITKEAFGSARYINLFGKEKQGENEIFFHVDFLNAPNKRGYMEVTKDMKDIFATLSQFYPAERLRSVSFIETDYAFHVVFEDGTHLSSKMYQLPAEEFFIWASTITPEKEMQKPRRRDAYER